MNSRALNFSIGILFVILSNCSVQPNNFPEWQTTLRTEIQSVGYGNWIVITDASYPYQNREGFRTITVEADVPEVVNLVLNEMERTQHVRPRFYVTRELRSLTNDQAPGINDHRKALAVALHGFPPLELNEELLNEQINASAKKYSVFIIKTKTALPYSSVFIDLDSGYWDNRSEQSIRERIQLEDTNNTSLITE